MRHVSFNTVNCIKLKPAPSFGEGATLALSEVGIQNVKKFFTQVVLLLSILQIYRVSIKSFPDYKHLLQENYVEYKHIFFFQM